MERTKHRLRRRSHSIWERRPKDGPRPPKPVCAGSTPVAPAVGSVAQRIRARGFYPRDEGSIPFTPAKGNTTGSATAGSYGIFRGSITGNALGC